MHDTKTIAQSNFATSDANNLALIPPNKERIALIIGNRTGAAIGFNVGTTPTLTTGIPIPNGESYTLSEVIHGSGITDQIRVLCGGAGQVVPYTEFICSCVNRQATK